MFSGLFGVNSVQLFFPDGKNSLYKIGYNLQIPDGIDDNGNVKFKLLNISVARILCVFKTVIVFLSNGEYYIYRNIPYCYTAGGSKIKPVKTLQEEAEDDKKNIEESRL